MSTNGWPAALVQWRERIRGGRSPDHRPDSWPYGVRDDALYKSTFFIFSLFRTVWGQNELWRIVGKWPLLPLTVAHVVRHASCNVLGCVQNCTLRTSGRAIFYRLHVYCGSNNVPELTWHAALVQMMMPVASLLQISAAIIKSPYVNDT